MHIVMANQGGNNVLRDYRKGNWTVQETMVLIEAKRMDDERRMKRQGDSVGGEKPGGKPAELRWKWVEDYCWRNGCLRSQNQCNDKWDNLMRDFKKVREYERRLADHQQQLITIGESSSERERSDEKSYWKLEKNERKANNLPSNLLPQIYDALVEVVEKKVQRGSVVGLVGAGGTTASIPNVPPSSAAALVGQPSSLPPSMQHLPISPPVSALPLPPPVVAQTPVQQQQQHPHTHPFSQQLPTSDSDTSEHSDSPAKRRRRGEGTSGGASGSESHEVGTAISRSASVIAETIQACEEREERRHRELLSLHERRLQIEESKAEISRQGINGLVDAVNKLANSILALASHKTQSTPK
nr:trihelix transcription factor ASR3-like isoform X2 [Coffea arabica]